MPVWIRLFGPVELWAADIRIDLGAPRQRCVFAVLAMTPGRAVSTDAMLDNVWGSQPPAHARSVLYTYISRLRSLLPYTDPSDDGVTLRRRDGGYALEVEPDYVDLFRARRLADKARALDAQQPENEARAAELLREAGEQWSDPPLAGITGDWAVRARTGLERERFALMTDRFAAAIRIGQHNAVIGPLSDMLAAHPLAESLAAQLMLALHHAGRQAEALGVYARTSALLTEELGVDPGTALRELHQRILQDQLPRAPTPLPPMSSPQGSSPPKPPAPESSPPRQLPPDLTGFTGRSTYVDQLDAIQRDNDGPPAPMVITAIGGTAGVGKTALAVHWSHRVANEFPDGQLYVNLRGFGPGPPVDPAAAVRDLLDALHVPPHRIPANPDGLVGLYRSLLAEQRVLIVLDNAHDSEQVRPLLPGAAGCHTVVTSRNRLSSLVAVEGARTLTLDLLTVAEARQLLEHRIGADRVAAEPEATDEIIARCARLPLALAIVAARVAVHPRLPLDALVKELSDARTDLDGLSDTDATIDLRATFSWSYQALSPDAARLFRLLALHPGPDITAAAAASLVGLPVQNARCLFDELVLAHLISEPAYDRYSYHDLLRVYADELTDTYDTPEDQHAALHRLFDHYLHTAHAAALCVRPHRERLDLAMPMLGVTPENIRDHRQALGWFAIERPVLRSAVERAAATGFDRHAWQLAWTLVDFLQRDGHWRDWATTQTTALQAAQRLADPRAQATAQRGLAGALTFLGAHDDAYTHLLSALDRFTMLGDVESQAQVLGNIRQVLSMQDRYQEALGYARRTLDLYEAGNDAAGQATALNGIGWLHAKLGNYQQALSFCRQALTQHQKVGDRYGQAATWDSLGYVHHRLSQHRHAVTCYLRALYLVRGCGDRYREAEVLTCLGDVHHTAGELGAARDVWRHAWRILNELDHPDANKVRSKLGTAALNHE